MADCRSLIEFLRAFERRRRAPSSSDPSPCSQRARPRPRRGTSCSSSNTTPRRRPFTSLCDRSPPTPTAALDVLALLAVLSALAFLAAPYAMLLAREAAGLVRQYPDEPAMVRADLQHGFLFSVRMLLLLLKIQLLLVSLQHGCLFSVYASYCVPLIFNLLYWYKIFLKIHLFVH
jgi:hypothetical protein